MRQLALISVLGILLTACSGSPGSPTLLGSSAPPPTSSPAVGPNPTATPVPPAASLVEPATSPSADPPSPSGAPITRSPVPTAFHRPSTCVSLGVYTVMAGDTLWAIARAFDTTVQALLAANPQITDRRLIRVGEEITISPIVLGTLGGMTAQALDINNRGQVVGWAATAAGYSRAFLWEDGAMTDLGTLGGDSSGAQAINDRGQVVGYSSIAPDDPETPRTFHAFLWEDGAMTDIGSLGGQGISPSDINERGQIVGFADTPSGETHAFVWEHGVMTDIGTLGGIESQAFGVNERGQVVGQSFTGSSPHAFLWQDGVMTDIGTFGWYGAWATRINDQGQLALLVSEPSGASHAAIADGGSVTLLEDAEGATRMAFDINNAGQVIGWDQIGMDGGNRAFAWQGGTTTPLTAADDYTEAQAINDCGQIVGQSGAAWVESEAVMWTVAATLR